MSNNADKSKIEKEKKEAEEKAKAENFKAVMKDKKDRRKEAKAAADEAKLKDHAAAEEWTSDYRKGVESEIHPIFKSTKEDYADDIKPRQGRYEHYVGNLH